MRSALAERLEERVFLHYNRTIVLSDAKYRCRGSLAG